MEAVADNYQLKWHSYNAHLHTCVAAALNNETFADVTLFTIDGHRIFAHRFVLSACSQYLHQVLKLQHKQASTLPIVIILPPEINYKTMKILIQYMYSGETTVSKDVLESVLRGGDILKVRGLWRPKEEESHKKLVKLHQKHEPINENSNLPRETSHSKQPVKENSLEYSKVPLQEEKGKNETPDTIPLKEKPKGTLNQPNKPEESTSQDQNQFLVIKEEPIEWSEMADSEMQLVDENEVFQTEMTIKPEIYLEGSEQGEEEQLYTPLTCELCTETFALPADWVRHIQTHTDMLPAKRQRRGKIATDEETGTFPPLQCDMCQKYFPTPAEWVHHVQNTHTDIELRLSNMKNPKSSNVKKPIGYLHKICSLCNKKFPSHASMVIHKRTHTGERPYMCEYCNKGFNVKSNLLRHLRTLHDKIINSGEIDFQEENVKDQENR